MPCSRRGLSYPPFCSIALRRHSVREQLNRRRVTLELRSRGRILQLLDRPRGLSIRHSHLERYPVPEHHLPQEHRDRVRRAHAHRRKHPRRPGLELRLDPRRNVPCLSPVHTPDFMRLLTYHICDTEIAILSLWGSCHGEGVFAPEAQNQNLSM